jgi:hypothetical protein
MSGRTEYIGLPVIIVLKFSRNQNIMLIQITKNKHNVAACELKSYILLLILWIQPQQYFPPMNTSKPARMNKAKELYENIKEGQFVYIYCLRAA